MTYPFDQNQQLLGYLQGWRQLLESLAAAASAMAHPASPSGMPPMPPYPPVVPSGPPTTPAIPVPTDYTQQLFGQLQLWRQHLEQMTGAPPVPAPPSTTPTSENASAIGMGQPGKPSRVPTEPDNPGGGRTSIPMSLYVNRSEPTPPPRVERAPVNQSGTQVPYGLTSTPDHDSLAIRPSNEGGSVRVPGFDRQPAVMARGPRTVTGPIFESPQFGAPGRARSSTAAHAGPAAAARSAAPVRAVDSSAPIQAAPKSRFKGLADRTKSLGDG